MSETIAPPWMPIAVKYIGFHEQPGNRGIEHFIELAHTGQVGDAWCAIYANGVLEEAGFRGTRSARARSFEDDPNFVRLEKPIYGCIVTRWRGSRASGLGHVYFFLKKNADGSYRALAGNEDDAVREYDEDPSKVTGYWWPKAYPIPGAAPTKAPLEETLFQVRGRMSVFGGPGDKESGNPQEGLALWSSEALMRQHGIGDFLLPANGMGLFRRLDTEKFYSSCRWNYKETPVSVLRESTLVIENESTGEQVATRPVDWGPHERTGRVVDISPGAARAIHLKTDDIVTATLRPLSARETPVEEPAPRLPPEPPPIAIEHSTLLTQLLASLKARDARLKTIEDRLTAWEQAMSTNDSSDPVPVSPPPFDPAKFAQEMAALGERLTSLAVLFGKLPPPAASNIPNIVVAAPTPPTPALQNPSVQLSAAGLGASLLAMATGFLGTPFGTGVDPTANGTLATIIPIVTGLVGMTGGWGAALNIGLKVVGPLLRGIGGALAASAPK